MSRDKEKKTSLDFEVLKDGSKSNPLNSYMGLILLVYFMSHLHILFVLLQHSERKKKRKSSLKKYVRSYIMAGINTCYHTQ